MVERAGPGAAWSETVTKRAVVVRGDVAIVPLTQGYEAIIDAVYAERVGQWNWYAQVSGGGSRVCAGRNPPRPSRRTILLHREIAEWAGLFAAAANDNLELEIDHINGDPRDNRVSNLRVCSSAENNKNKRRRKDSTSGMKGVCWHSRDRKWRARIQVDGHRKHLGLFDDPSEASRVYEAAAEYYFEDFKRPQEHY